jgi:NAD(P)H-flavin reductase
MSSASARCHQHERRSGCGRFVHTVRDVGAVSGAITKLEAVPRSAARAVRHKLAGRGSAKARTSSIVAGGLGLAPLRPAIYHVLANRARYGRVVILFGSRNPKDMLYRHELEQWRQRLDVDIEVTVDHADADWHGNVGVVPALIPRVDFRPSRYRRAGLRTGSDDAIHGERAARRRR